MSEGLVVLFSTHNGAQWLPRVLDGYRQCCASERPWRIVSVNNGSTDSTEEILRQYASVLPLTILSEPAPGKNRALNTGIEHLKEFRGDFIFTDDDAIPSRRFLSGWLDTLSQHQDYALFGGRVVLEFPSEIRYPIQKYKNHFGVIYALNDREEGEIASDQIYGPNMAVRSDLFSRGFRFDENIGPSCASTDYPMGSETEFCVRVAKSTGARCWFTRATLAAHIVRPHQTDEQFILARATRHGRGVAVRLMQDRDDWSVGKAHIKKALFAFLARFSADWRWQAAWQDGFISGLKDRSDARP